MFAGYQVSLGNNQLNGGDAVALGMTAVTVSQDLGTGTLDYSYDDGAGGTINATATGSYVVGTDGGIYFIPDSTLQVLTSASVSTAPTYTVVTGTASNETVTGTADDDIIYGGSQGDFAGTGSDQINAGAGNDVIYSGDGNNTVFGGAGDDTFIIQGDLSANDTFYGGEGTDTMVLSPDDDRNLTVDMTTGSVNDGVAGAQVFSGVENITTAGGNDTVTGDANDNVISTNGGDDVVNSGAGDDTVIGGDGDDTITAGTGNDTVFGDSGDSATGNVEHVSWNNDGTLTNFSDLSGGFTQNTGSMDVTFTQANDGAMGVTQNYNGTQYVGSDDPWSATSSLYVTGTGGADVSTSTLTFASTDPAYDDQVNSVSFRINDIDQTNGGWRDQLIIRAYDENGVEVPVVLTAAGGDTVANGQVTAADGSNSHTSANGSVLVEIPGPVSEVTIEYNNAGDPAGQFVLVSDVYFETIPVNTGNDSIDAGEGDDIVYGEAGNDTVDAGLGDDTVYGGSGSDTIYGDQADDAATELLFNGGFEAGVAAGGINTSTTVPGWTTPTGTAEVWGSGFNGISTSDGGNFVEIDQHAANVDGISQDVATVSGETYTLSIDAQQRTAGGTESFEIWFGGVLIDTVTPGDAWETYTYTVTGSGTDTVEFRELSSQSNGLGAMLDNASLIGLDPADSSNDALYGGADDDTIFGGFGDDTVSGDAGNDDISGGDGNDTLFGGDGDDTVSGDAGDDQMTGDAGTDTYYGGDGNDTFTIDNDDDLSFVYGGENSGDWDVLNFNTTTGGQGVDVTFDTEESGSFSFGDGGSDGTFAEIESVQYTGAADTVDASALTGGISANTAGGNDTIIGGAGNDTFDAGSGADTVDGGAGDDTINAGGGWDSVDGGAGNDTIYGANGFDNITGGEGADLIYGGNGNDTITFADGDTVYGDSGDDLFVLTDLGEPENGVITVVGGENGETNGDTLQLGTLADWSTLNITTPANVAGGMSGTITLDDGTILNFSEIENIICFTPDTGIVTPRGTRMVQDLRPGDLVVTRDHGLQPIRWIKSRTVPAIDRFAPIRIKNGVLSGQQQDILVSPQHRMLFSGYKSELLFGESEVLVAAKHLVDGKDVVIQDGGMVTYYHILFDQHEVIYANGAASESFHPGEVGLSAVTDAARAELFDLFPELRAMPMSYGATARRCLKQHEASLIL